MTLRLTLLSDGSSDRALIPILRWLLTVRHRVTVGVEATWADLRSLSPPPRKLRDRIEAALRFYPCEVPFVHRDAEGEAPDRRVTEIDAALRKLPSSQTSIVKVIPVRMREAWLLVSAPAIRRAAGNPNGAMELNLPPTAELKSGADPKTLLHQLLETASGLGPRRRRRLRPEQRAHRVAELIEDYSALLLLPAFQRLDSEVRSYLRETGRHSASS